jgi:hypothetical protein
MRSLLPAALAALMLAVPSTAASAKADPAVALHPSKSVSTNGVTSVRVAGSGFRSDFTIRIDQCVGQIGAFTDCLTLASVQSSSRGKFNTAVDVAQDPRLLDPFWPGPACSVPPATGPSCFVVATETLTGPGANPGSAAAPIGFR